MKRFFLLGGFIALTFTFFSFNNTNEEGVCSAREIEKQLRDGCSGGANVCCVSTAVKHM